MFENGIVIGIVIGIMLMAIAQDLGKIRDRLVKICNFFKS